MKWKWRQQTNELIINKSINSIHKLFFIWSSTWFNDKLMIQFNSIQGYWFDQLFWQQTDEQTWQQPLEKD